MSIKNSSNSILPTHSQTNLFQALRSYCFRKYPIIIIPPKPNDFLPSDFRAKILNTSLLHACDIPRQSYTPRFDQPNSIWWGTEVMTLPIKEYPPHSCYLLPLTHTCHHPMYSLNMTDQVSHSEKWKKKFLDRMVEGIIGVQSSLVSPQIQFSV